MNNKKHAVQMEKPLTAIEKPETGKPIWVEAEKMFERMAEVTKDVATKAFEFFLYRGSEVGKELEDWFRAESEILRPVQVEIREANGNFLVSAAVPGFKPDEIEVSVKDNILMISGMTEAREDRDDESVILREWKSNRFCRQLALPARVNAEKVEARLTGGMLELTLPKAAAEEETKIAVAAG